MCGGQSIRLSVICLFRYSNLSDTCTNLFSMAIGQLCRDDPTYLPNDSPTITETYTKWVSLSATVCFYRFTQGYLRDDSTALVGEDNNFGIPCVKGKAAVLLRVRCTGEVLFSKRHCRRRNTVVLSHEKDR